MTPKNIDYLSLFKQKGLIQHTGSKFFFRVEEIYLKNDKYLVYISNKPIATLDLLEIVYTNCTKDIFNLFQDYRYKYTLDNSEDAHYHRELINQAIMTGSIYDKDNNLLTLISADIKVGYLKFHRELPDGTVKNIYIEYYNLTKANDFKTNRD